MKFSHNEIYNEIKINGKNINHCLTQLYKEFLPVVRKVAKNYNIKDSSEIMALLQDVIIAFYTNIKNDVYKEEGKLYGYIYKIGEYIMINSRKYDKKVEKKLDFSTQYDAIAPDVILPEIYSDEREKIVNYYMQKLKPDCQTILNYFYFEKLSLKEIAEKMGLKDDDVAKNKKARCFSALQDIILKSKDYSLKELSQTEA